MVEGLAARQAAVEDILDLMARQCQSLFTELAGVTLEQLWFRAGPGEWSIGENIDHLRVIYTSLLFWFKVSWYLFHPLARLRRHRPYRVEIDNVYHRPTFPQNVGWIWPPRYTPARPVSLDTLYTGLDEIQAQVREFYSARDADVLGHVVLWDPAIGAVNLIQALRVGVYHDEVHIDSIRKMTRVIKRKSG